MPGNQFEPENAGKNAGCSLVESNHLLAALLAPSPEAIGADFELVLHRSRRSVSARRNDSGWIHFPVRGAFSILQTADGIGGIEVALVGTCGMAGLPWPRLEESWREVSVIPHDGAQSLRIRAPRLMTLLDQKPIACEAMIRYLGQSWLKLALNLACLRHHPVEMRLARWIAQMLDHYPEPEVKVTQELLAQLLGVRRGAISGAASSLQAQRLIRYSRGVIRVVNRRALVEAACDCYRRHREIDIATTGTPVTGSRPI